MIRSNKDLKKGQVLQVSFGEDRPLVECAFIEPIEGGYTKCLVQDIDPDREVISTINNSWAKRLIRNHARGAEYIIHIKQIHDEQV